MVVALSMATTLLTNRRGRDRVFVLILPVKTAAICGGIAIHGLSVNLHPESSIPSQLQPSLHSFPPLWSLDGATTGPLSPDPFVPLPSS